MQHINLYAPKVILVPDTAFPGPGLQTAETKCSKLVEEIENQLGITCRPVPRRHWDPENGEQLEHQGSRGQKKVQSQIFPGLSYLQRLAIDDDSKAPTIVASSEKYAINRQTLNALTSSRYYARCAIAAALEWLSPGQLLFKAGSVRTQYVALEGISSLPSDL